MSAFASLITLGFRNPIGQERDQVIQSHYVRAKDFMGTIPSGNSGEEIPGPEQQVTAGANEKITRFICLSPEEIVQSYNTSTDPAALKAVPCFSPVSVFATGDSVSSLVLLASDGSIVICVEELNKSYLTSDYEDPVEHNMAQRPKATTKQASAHHIPRPPNAFILYRNHKTGEIKAKYPHLGNNDISKVIGRLWHQEDEALKQSYRQMAKLQTEELLRKFPDYHYQPRRSSEIIPRPGAQKKDRVRKAKAITRRKSILQFNSLIVWPHANSYKV
ncbi:Similar to Mating-type protein a-1; acc. no. P36981 [Pyronema omphalodes CBS 100304]|uniref:Similar to Mating-type protein a-1 acc. no. P36981 n=1 Tax=Pyronema omphalodes (strain CBS 100304) TaxID=1076935 RepID=U4LEG7_PYROM|nr:Similar to Mating-type protein a-1; acc. no. P36981 [Pyronema omphalodes CBS 100304]